MAGLGRHTVSRRGNRCAEVRGIVTGRMDDDIPVLVVGAGPVGTTLALELAYHGVRCVLVDRYSTPSPHPKMDYLNGRSMELLRRLGAVEPIREKGVGAENSFNFLWLTSITEPPLTTWEYLSVADVAQRMATMNDGSSP